MPESCTQSAWKRPCNRAGIPLDSFGFGFMGDIGKLEGKIRDACGGDMTATKSRCMEAARST